MIWYKDFPQTIKLYGAKDKNGKGVMRPVKAWANRDEKCQPILSYQENAKETLNIGLVMERLLIIDIDVGHSEGVDGRRSFSNWIKQYEKVEQEKITRDIANTMRVNTPSGGMHIYFLIPDKNKGYSGKKKIDAMEGVDLLTGKNQYIPAPHNQRIDGKYTIHEDSGENIIEAPKWVIDLFEEASNEKKDKIKIPVYDYGEGTVFKLTNVKDIEVGNNLNGILTDSFRGFEKGARNESMTSHIGKIINEVKYRRLSMDNGINLAKLTARNCQPPMKGRELLTIWQSVVKREKKRGG